MTGVCLVKFQINDVVGRKSYNCDILFRIMTFKTINQKTVAVLIGEDYRLIADSPLEDLQIIDETQVELMTRAVMDLEEQSLATFFEELEKQRLTNDNELLATYDDSTSFFHMPGLVLHLDGDADYLEKCLQAYDRLKIPVVGIHCTEKEMVLMVKDLITEYRPSILVITGHDAYSRSKGSKNELNAYRHSKDFINTIIEARKVRPSLDDLIIFAGACQSYFEALIQAGANFASSPNRINIHALDPVYVVAKISFTPFTSKIDMLTLLKSTLSGLRGIGGIETKGVLRIGMPYNKSVFFDK